MHRQCQVIVYRSTLDNAIISKNLIETCQIGNLIKVSLCYAKSVEVWLILD